MRPNASHFAILFLSREYGRNVRPDFVRIESVFTVEIVGFCDYLNGFPDEPELWVGMPETCAFCCHNLVIRKHVLRAAHITILYIWDPPLYSEKISECEKHASPCVTV
jgi:hypothetical protein